MGLIAELKEQIRVAKEKDPAALSAFEIILTYSGVHAIIFHRIAYWLNKKRIPFLPRWISQVSKFYTGIEIHPGAQIGRRLFIDHGMGVVIGETTVIGDNCLLYQGVTLGGTGKERGKRHPTLGNNVIVSAGAKVLGSITIGSNVVIGAGAVVINPVPDGCTVVCVPGKIVKIKGEKVLSDEFRRMNLPDPVNDLLTELKSRIDVLENEIKILKTKDKNKTE